MIDSHAHMLDERFDEDRSIVINDLAARGISLCIEAGVDKELSYKARELSRAYSNIYAMAGVHPHDAKSAGDDLEDWLCELYGDDKCVAIGETGLDYHRYLSPADAQKAVFERHLQIAADTGKALALHCRRAHDDMMDILRGYAPLRGVMHCFCDGQRELEEILELGLHIGLGGAVTYEYSAETLEAIARLPAERLMLETDCPYLVPAPCVGKRCESPVIAVTAEYVAQAMNLSAEEVLRAAAENAGRLYGIDISK